MIQVRRLTDTETTSAIVIYFSIFVGLGGLATLPFGWVVPDRLQLLALISAGFCGGIAHIMTTTSYRYAPASFLAPFDYSSMIWAFMLGYAFFGEIPAAFVAVGAVIDGAAGSDPLVGSTDVGGAGGGGRITGSNASGEPGDVPGGYRIDCILQLGSVEY